MCSLPTRRECADHRSSRAVPSERTDRHAQAPPAPPGRERTLSGFVWTCRSSSVTCLTASFFEREQGLFGLEASGKSSEGAGDANDAVARRDDGDGVLAVRGSHRPRRSRVPQLTSDLAVRSCLAERDAKK